MKIAAASQAQAALTTNHIIFLIGYLFAQMAFIVMSVSKSSQVENKNWWILSIFPFSCERE